jgi:AAA15 family ATPase/GTPase
MLEKIEIRNFRCFESITLSNLARVNIVVGPNSAGKTALMEAIFLVSGANPELAFRIKAFRGLNTLALSVNRTSYEALWKDLFYGFDQSKKITISMQGTRSFGRELTIGYQREKTLVLEISSKDILKDSVSPIVPISFEWMLSTGQKISAEPEIRNNGVAVKFSGETSAVLPLPIAFYTSALQATQEENANYFSALSVQNKEKEIVEALKSEFPFINGLSVEISGGVPTLFAAIEDVGEKIPLNLVSSGVTKLMGILLGIANQAGGIVCIDEIENGFYFDRLPSIWNIIFEFAKRFDVQIIASTHSWECLQALSDCASSTGELSEFCLVQSSEVGEKFRTHSGDSFVKAMAQQIDVR